MNKYAYRMGYVPMASELDNDIANLPNSGMSGDEIDRMRETFNKQSEYVKEVARSAVESIDAMVAVCGMVYKEAFNGFNNPPETDI